MVDKKLHNLKRETWRRKPGVETLLITWVEKMTGLKTFQLKKKLEEENSIYQVKI